ncbi:MAG: hypothetical protein HY962_06135 [Ignavibacteriae bacterium]|nr:hypothetical protein [Ignavibacteriota bacterium]
MKSTSILIVGTIIFLFCCTPHVWARAGSAAAQVQKLMSPTIGFWENKGQVRNQNGEARRDLLYIGILPSGKVHLRMSGFSYELVSHLTNQAWTQQEVNTADDCVAFKRQLSAAKWIRSHRVDVDFLGVSQSVNVEGLDVAQDVNHYYLDGMPESGVTGVRRFNTVVYRDVYPGIDVRFIMANSENFSGGIKYEFVVHPGADPTQIRMRLTGQSSLLIDSKGNLIIGTSKGTIREAAPVSYILHNSNPLIGSRETRTMVVSAFDVKNDTLSFSIRTYDRTKTLIIDPTVSWSTFYGGSGTDYFYGTFTDGSGNVVVSGGTTSSSNIATSGVHQVTYAGNEDAVTVMFDVQGGRQWGTYFGGAAQDAAYYNIIDSNGDIFVGGTTLSSSGIATTGAHQTSYGGSGDGFILALSPSGTRSWSTYFGGASDEVAGYLVSDQGESRAVYFSGNTSSSSGIASPGAYQTTFGGTYDAFLVKLRASSGTVIWSTYYGGSGDDHGHGLAIAENSDVFLTGFAGSTSGIATAGTHQTSNGGSTDAMIVRFDSAGSRIWGTYYGGYGADGANGISCDDHGRVVIHGNTTSTSSIASSGAFQTSYSGGYDGFVARLSGTGTRLWGTYLGGPSEDRSFWTETNQDCEIYISGSTQSTSGIGTTGTPQPAHGGGGNDGFVVKFDSSGARMWGTYFGGSGWEYGRTVALDGNGGVYLCGETQSTSGIATSGAYQVTNGGGSDGFIVRLTDGSGSTQRSVATSAVSGSPFCPGDTVIVTFTITGTFNAGNTFSAQLSSVSGSFAIPVTIGTRDSITAGPIICIIPMNTQPGSMYRIRVIASNPSVIGSDNGSNLTIADFPTAAISALGNTTICVGDSVGLQANSGPGYSYRWKKDGTTVSGALGQVYHARYAAVYTVVVTNASGCSSESSPVSVSHYPADPTSLVWTGAGSRIWSTTGNWDNPCVIPTTGDTVIIPPQTNPPLGVPSITLSRFSLDNAGGTTLEGTLTITGTLELHAGRISAGLHHIYMSQGAEISAFDSAAYVVTDSTGSLVYEGLGSGGTTRFVPYPVGSRAFSYTPVSLQNTGTLDDYSIRVMDDVLTGGVSGAVISSNVVGKTWMINEAQSGGSNASFSLQWNVGNELSGFDRTSCYIARHNGANWQRRTPFIAASGSDPYSLVIMNVTALSPFAVGDAGSPLPVQFLHIAAERYESGVRIIWRTASERNNLGFQVERRVDDNSEWSVVGFVPSHATAENGGSYSYIDRMELRDPTIYRLRQQDMDGTSQLSPECRITAEYLSETPLRCVFAPHPVKGAGTVRITSAQRGSGRFIVYDAFGRTVLPLRTLELRPGENVIGFDMSSQPHGLYWYSLDCGDHRVTGHFVIGG